MTAMGEPVWALATLLPRQGDWSEEAYLAFHGEQSRIELVDGFIEVLPVPTDRHQAILTLLLVLISAYAQQVGGKARPAGLRVRLRAGRFREPDVLFLTKERLHLRGEDYWCGADLTVEIVSGGADDRVRDLVTKRRDYAEAGIPEYWIVDPEAETVTVLRLDGEEYATHGVFGRGTTAISARYEGLAVAVDAVFDAD
jgi:Uma2 family endonuclease